MNEHSEARRELEASLRSLLPEKVQIGNSLTSSKPAVAIAGLGGVVSGYFWGRIRGRRLHKKKS